MADKDMKLTGPSLFFKKAFKPRDKVCSPICSSSTPNQKFRLISLVSCDTVHLAVEIEIILNKEYSQIISH